MLPSRLVSLLLLPHVRGPHSAAAGQTARIHPFLGHEGAVRTLAQHMAEQGLHSGGSSPPFQIDKQPYCE